MFLDVYDLHGVLDTSSCWMLHCGEETIDPFGQIVTGLVGGLWLDRQWKDCKSEQGVS